MSGETTLLRTRVASSAVTAALVLSASSAAHAACPTGVASGETQTTTATLGSANTCAIEQGGAIDVLNAATATGIDATDTNSIMNNGSVSAAAGNGGVAAGITANDFNTIVGSGAVSAIGGNASNVTGIGVANNNTMTLSGPITASAGDGGPLVRGINALNTNTITTSGAITATGGLGADAYGIYARDGNTVTNSGSVSASGAAFSDVAGILIRSGNSVTNTGRVSASGGSGVFGIFGANSNFVTNSSVVTATGASAVEVIGIYSFASGTIINTGEVRATGGVSNIGLFSFSDGTMINSGTVIAAGPTANAIGFGDGANTLTLLQNSRISGGIRLGIDADAVTLGRGENWLMTFNQDPTLGGNTLDTRGRPFALLNGGLTVATFDAATTLFGIEDEALSDLTGAINSALHDRLTSGNPASYVWMQGFKSARDSSGNASGTGGDDVRLTGGLAGFSLPLASWARGGLFAGYAEADLESAFANSIGGATRRHAIEQDGWFGGAYGRAFAGQVYTDIIVTAGSTESESRRRVLNNLDADGVETATGSRDGWLVNSEATVGMELPMMGVLVVPSASVGYAAHFLDGFTESGSLASVAFASRDVEIVEGRLQVELRKRWEDAFGSWLAMWRGGVKGRSNIGDDDLVGVLANTTAFNVAIQGDDDAAAVFLGTDVTWSPAAGMALFAGLEGALESQGDTVLNARFGANLKF